MLTSSVVRQYGEKRAAADPNGTDSRRGAHGMTVWVPRAGGRPNTLRSPPLRQYFYMTWHLWGSVAIRSEMAEIQDCACCRRPTAGLYQLQLGRCTASDPPTPPCRPRRLSQAQRSSLKGPKTAIFATTRVNPARRLTCQTRMVRRATTGAGARFWRLPQTAPRRAPFEPCHASMVTIDSCE